MDALYNWSNHLVPNKKRYAETIASKINQKVAAGFSLDDTVNLLVGEGEDLDMVQQIADYMLSQIEQTETTASSETKNIPVKYADIQDDVAKLVSSLGSVDFTNIFASKDSLMSLSDKKQEDFKELLWYAKRHPEDRKLMAEVHNYVRPYVEQAIEDSQILAKEATDNKMFKFNKVAENVYTVKDGGDKYQVDIANRTCTCPRYVLSGFNLLGLTCEHILAASREFDEHFDEKLIGKKTVFAYNYGNNRYAWCSRSNSEVAVDDACISANCPFMQEDKGKTISCSFC